MTLFGQHPSFWRDRLRASTVHLGISLGIALLCAVLVFGIWYPYPYREISGGRELFLLVVTVDVILGPLITLAVFNRAKPWRDLRRDLSIVGLMQLAALGYGLWTVCVARPVHLVFEIDRFRVVHAIDISSERLAQAPSNVNAMPLTGPTLLAVRPFKDTKEGMEMTLAALQGVSLGARPELWQPYANAAPEVLRAAKPVPELKSRFASRAAEIDTVLAASGQKAANMVYVPMVGRNSFWTLFLDSQTAAVVAAMQLDPF